MRMGTSPGKKNMTPSKQIMTPSKNNITPTGQQAAFTFNLMTDGLTTPQKDIPQINIETKNSDKKPHNIVPSLQNLNNENESNPISVLMLDHLPENLKEHMFDFSNLYNNLKSDIENDKNDFCSYFLEPEMKSLESQYKNTKIIGYENDPEFVFNEINDLIENLILTDEEEYKNFSAEVDANIKIENIEEYNN